MKTKNNIAIIFAGGVGSRLNGEDTVPKQFLKVFGKPIIIHTLEIFQQNKNIDKIYISIVESHYQYMKELIEYYHLTKVSGITVGGVTGQDSIYNALKMAETENADDSIVLIHDGVRPNITQDVIDRNVEYTEQYGSAITCTPCYETVLISEDGKVPTNIPYRRQTYTAQAPQSFILKDVINAHEAERKINPDYTDIIDSCTLFKKHGNSPAMIMGNFGNIKITKIEDLYILRALIQYREDMEALGVKGE